MSVEVLDSATIRNFIEDERAFNSFVDDRFARLDADVDGLLSYVDMLKGLRNFGFMGPHCNMDAVEPSQDELRIAYQSLLLQFDRDQNGTIKLEEFREEIKKMMLAIANGLGSLPVQMVLEEDSFLKKAVDRERRPVS